MITANLLRGMFPSLSNPDDFVGPLEKVCEKFFINTPLRVAAFLAQVGHESAGFRVLKENLNYGAPGLQTTFGKYFPTAAMANAYARQPAKIAGLVYANRMGNGNETSGDGWTYRGRGALQLTGKANYQAFATSMGLSLTQAVSYLETPEGACMSAGWFWERNGLNTFADKGDFITLTRRINGGTNGLADRQELYAKAKKLLAIR